MSASLDMDCLLNFICIEFEKCRESSLKRRSFAKG